MMIQNMRAFVSEREVTLEHGTAAKVNHLQAFHFTWLCAHAHSQVGVFQVPMCSPHVMQPAQSLRPRHQWMRDKPPTHTHTHTQGHFQRHSKEGRVPYVLEIIAH